MEFQLQKKTLNYSPGHMRQMAEQIIKTDSNKKNVKKSLLGEFDMEEKKWTK